MKPTSGKLYYYTVALKEAINQATDEQRELMYKFLDRYIERYKQIRTEVDEVSLAAGFNERIQEEVNKLFEDVSFAEKITCKSGCSFCCHQYVVVTDDEAKLIIEYCREVNIQIDWDSIERKANLNSQNEHDYSKIPYLERKCTFLGDDNKCKIYKHRPAVCRKLYVTNDPKMCDSSVSSFGSVMWATSTMAEIITSAMYNATKSGQMDQMLLENRDYVQPPE
jgi:Fe-S-cluster containining protein